MILKTLTKKMIAEIAGTGLRYIFIQVNTSSFCTHNKKHAFVMIINKKQDNVVINIICIRK